MQNSQAVNITPSLACFFFVAAESTTCRALIIMLLHIIKSRCVWVPLPRMFSAGFGIGLRDRLYLAQNIIPQHHGGIRNPNPHRTASKCWWKHMAFPASRIIPFLPLFSYCYCIIFHTTISMRFRLNSNLQKLWSPRFAYTHRGKRGESLRGQNNDNKLSFPVCCGTLQKEHFIGRVWEAVG